MLTISDMRNQNMDNTPYTDEQLLFVSSVLNNIQWKWTPFSSADISVEKQKGAFGDVYVLHIDKLCYMTTYPADILDHRTILEEAYGDILLTGLGLGVGVVFAYHNPKVSSITVIENNSTIIEKIAPMICKNMTRITPNVIEQDANMWVPDRHFDFAYIDHAYSRADSERYQEYCTRVVNWYDERVKLEKTWR